MSPSRDLHGCDDGTSESGAWLSLSGFRIRSPASLAAPFSVTPHPDDPPAIYVMNADGSGKTALTDSHVDSDPAWSPDGSRIVFSTNQHESAFVSQI